jgi:hypothetical protein
LVVNTSAYANATTGIGANYFINAGVKLLDRLTSISDLSALRSEALAADGYEMDASHIKALEQVSFRDSDDEIAYLAKLTMKEIRVLYPDLGSTDSGTPVHYALYTQRTFATDTEATADAKMGIMIMPPTDEAITIDMVGKFRSGALSSDSDVNFWTLIYPELLEKAANYEIEVTMRNTQGQADWMAAIQDALTQIDHDAAEEESADVTHMEDSYVP